MYFLIIETADGELYRFQLYIKEEHIESFLLRMIRAKTLVTSKIGIFYDGEKFSTIENSKPTDRVYINMGSVVSWRVEE